MYACAWAASASGKRPVDVHVQFAARDALDQAGDHCVNARVLGAMSS
jgi:hypothetical protein